MEDVLEDVSSANFDGLNISNNISNQAMQKGNSILASRPLAVKTKFNFQVDRKVGNQLDHKEIAEFDARWCQ